MPVGRVNPDKQILGNLVKRMAKSGTDPLTPLIDKYYLLRNKPGTARLRSVRLPLVERPRPGGRLSPSNLLGCERAAVFKYTETPGVKRTDPQSEAIFDDGNWRHHRWQSNFRDMQRVLGRENFRVLSVEQDITIPDLFIAGSLDIVIWIKGVGKIVVDFKGINDFGFTRIVSTNEPIPKHVDQIIPYMKGRGVMLGLLFYENKNDNRWRCFMVKWNGEVWEKIEHWAGVVIGALEDERLPNRDLECQEGTYMEERCPWAKLCYGEKENEEIRSRTYLNFPGVQEAWNASHSDPT